MDRPLDVSKAPQAARWSSEHEDTAFKLAAAEHFENAGDVFFAAGQDEQAIGLALQRGASAEAEAVRLRAHVTFEETRKPAE